jgi:catechol 2,3-dioxygenase-like lactoylglutathione lyase family enzyme
VAPFIIADETGRDGRIPRQRTHVNGVTGIGTVTVAVDDVARVRGWYEKILKAPGADVTRDDVGGAGVRFAIGPHTFDFVAPSTASSPLTAWLAARGPSPYAATFKGGAGRAGALDLAKTHAARLALA